MKRDPVVPRTCHEGSFGPVGWLRGPGVFCLQLLRPFVFGWVLQVEDGTLMVTLVAGRGARAERDGWICLNCGYEMGPREDFCLFCGYANPSPKPKSERGVDP